MPQNNDNNKPTETNPEAKPSDNVQPDPNLISIMQETRDPEHTKEKLVHE